MKDIISYISELRPLSSLMKLIWSLIGLVIVSIVFVFVLRSGKVSTYPIGWERTFPITPYEVSVNNIHAASRGNLIAAVYEGKSKNATGIYVSISFDGGKRFIQPIRIASVYSKTSINPHIAISGDGHMSVVWQSLMGEDPNSRIFYSISGDMGASWSEPIRLYLPSEMELLPQVIYDDRGVLHIFYNAFKDGAFNIFHIVSYDEKSFSTPQRLVNISAGLRGAFFPAIHTSKSSIFVVWQGKGEKQDVLSDSLFFIMSKNYGKSWSLGRRLTSSNANDSSPFITSYKDVLYLVYQNNERRNWSIKLLKGYEKGKKWEAEPITISTTNADCYSPLAVIPDSEDVFIVWYDAREKKSGIFARRYSIREGKLTSEVRLSRRKKSARGPVAISMGRKVIVMWEEANRIVAKNSDIYVEPPVVYSKTHPQNVWSKLPQAIIEWKPPIDESGIVGYATFLSKPPIQDFNPIIQNIDVYTTKIKTPILDDGIYHFHIRAIDRAGNYSRTVHYRIQVSINPPPMPLVFSPTHPEGKGVDSRAPLLKWRIDDITRLKGFLYSISKGFVKKPNIFTKDSEVMFNNLEDGRYFFNIRSVDKTNALSRIVTYEIIVGRAEELDVAVYGRITKAFLEGRDAKPKKTPRRKAASVEIDLPFDITEPLNKAHFDAHIVTKNISKRDIIGYSVFVDRTRHKPSDRINHRSDYINAKNLKNGEYFIGAKCRYFQGAKGRKRLLWTEPVIKRFYVSLPVEKSPVISYMDSILRRLTKSWIPVSVSLMSMIISLAAIGFGTKIPFYTRLFHLRIINFFRLL